MKQFYAVWYFKTITDAVSAVRQELFENGSCVCSWGEDDRQYEGFDATAFNIKYDKANGLVKFEWADDVPLDCDMDKYWLSPYCFEVETYSKDGKPLNGESDAFGSRDKVGAVTA